MPIIQSLNLLLNQITKVYLFMKRKFTLFCFIMLLLGCQKQTVLTEKSEVQTEVSHLQLLETNDPFVDEIIGCRKDGSKTKTGSIENKIDWENPWLLDLRDDEKERVVFCLDNDNDFTDRKIIFVKDGDKRFSYIIERAYVYSHVDNIDELDVSSKSTFSGILTIYTSENTPLYSYFYSKNNLVGEVNILKYTSKLNNTALKTQSAEAENIIEGGELGEATVWGTSSGGSGSSDIWFLNNSGRYTNWSEGWGGESDNNPSYNYQGGGGNVSSTNPKAPMLDRLPKDERADIELSYLKKRGEKELAEILEALLYDTNLTIEDKVAVYVAIHKAYLQLQGKYMMAITKAFSETLKPLIEIALFDVGGEVAYELLSYLPKTVTESSALIWKSLSNKSECYVSSKIPRSFLFTAKNGDSFYVTTSGTKHLDEILKKNGAINEPWFVQSSELRSQLILDDFGQAINKILEKNSSNLIYKKKYYEGGWEIMFNASNSGGCPVIYHALKL